MGKRIVKVAKIKNFFDEPLKDADTYEMAIWNMDHDESLIDAGDSKWDDRHQNRLVVMYQPGCEQPWVLLVETSHLPGVDLVARCNSLSFARAIRRSYIEEVLKPAQV